MEEETQEERQPIDAIGFAILCFLSDRNNTTKGLRELLEQFTRMELSRSPMYRRLSLLVEEGLVSKAHNPGDKNTFGLTQKGEQVCLEWAKTFQLLAALPLYTLEYTKTEEYVEESK